jgi:hypothetical protein
VSAPRHFEVDPNVMAALRPMQARDAPSVAALHHAAMGESLWAQLGVGFLTQLYRNLLDSEGFIAFVYEADHKVGVQGFIAGATDPDRVMATTFRRAWFLLGPAAFPAGLRPRVLRRLVHTARYASASRVAGLPSGPLPESLFCSFAPELRGKRIAGHANKALFDDLLSRGYGHVKITTDTSNSAAARQLRSWGFDAVGGFEFYGKPMMAWLLDLQTSPRVEPVGRHPMLER